MFPHKQTQATSLNFSSAGISFPVPAPSE